MLSEISQPLVSDLANGGVDGLLVIAILLMLLGKK